MAKNFLGVIILLATLAIGILAATMINSFSSKTIEDARALPGLSSSSGVVNQSVNGTVINATNTLTYADIVNSTFKLYVNNVSQTLMSDSFYWVNALAGTFAVTNAAFASENFTADYDVYNRSLAYNVMGNATEGNKNLSSNMGTIGTVGSIAIIILILLAAFGGFFLGKNRRM